MSADLNTIERLGPLISFKFVGGQDAGEVEGYGATFGGPPDAYGDVIAPGAFGASIAEHKAAGTMPAMLFSHDPKQPIGRWNHMQEDANGLHVKGKLTLDVAKARDVRALAADGALALSIGYRTRASAKLPGGNRLLQSVGLFEISPVAIPANSAARIVSVKSIDTNIFASERVFEEFLRDAGASRAIAKAIISNGFKSAMRLRDAADDADMMPLIEALKSGALTIRNTFKD